MDIFWVKLSRLNYDNFLEKITSSKEKNIIFTPNPEICLSAREDKEFKDILNKSTYNIPDAIGLYIAFQILDNTHSSLINTLLLPYFITKLFTRKKFLYEKYGDRIQWSNLTKDLLEYSQKNKVWITIIDLYNPTDHKKVASQKIMIEKLNKKYPYVVFHLYIYEAEKEEEIIKKINNTDDKILLVTLGAKKQEKLIISIYEKLDNIKIFAGIWSSIDYIIWFQRQAPDWIKSIWFEWLYRLFTGPGKLKRLKRIYNALFKFTYTVIIDKGQK